MRKINFNNRQQENKVVILIISLFAIFFGWQGNFEGGDIAGSRRSFLGVAPIDLWGSFSGLFYGLIPNQPIPWGMYLYLFQILLTTLSLLGLQKIFMMSNNVLSRLSFYIFSYIFLCFSTTLTRDSTMATFIIFGISIILNNSNLQKPSAFKYYLAIIFISIGISFRPWLTPIVLIILFFLVKKNQSKFLAISLTLLGLFLPVILNNSVYTFTNIKKVYPELQVLIQDGGSIACLSSYEKSRNEATEFLNIFNGSSYSNAEICKNYRLNTWTTLGNWNMRYQEAGLTSEPKPDYNDKRTPIIFINTNFSSEKYEEIRSSWISLISNNPKEYFRIKFIEFNQLLLLGDTSQLLFLNELKKTDGISIKSFLTAIFFMPWDLFIYLHLLAPLPIITFFSALVIFFSRENTIISVVKNKNFIFSYLFMTSYLILSTLAYIGDTGRYMYLPSLICWYFMSIGLKKKTYDK
jgi:hypothetical protein